MPGPQAGNRPRTKSVRLMKARMSPRLRATRPVPMSALIGSPAGSPPCTVAMCCLKPAIGSVIVSCSAAQARSVGSDVIGLAASNAMSCLFQVTCVLPWGHVPCVLSSSLYEVLFWQSAYQRQCVLKLFITLDNSITSSHLDVFRVRPIRCEGPGIQSSIETDRMTYLCWCH